MARESMFVSTIRQLLQRAIYRVQRLYWFWVAWS